MSGEGILGGPLWPQVVYGEGSAIIVWKGRELKGIAVRVLKMEDGMEVGSWLEVKFQGYLGIIYP